MRVSGNLELIGEFRRRFPLFDRIVGQFGKDTPSERIPWFFGFILAAAGKPGTGASCFVLDKTPGTTAIASVLAGFVRLQSDFPNLIERYARNALERGQRVRVRPSDYVYEYEGIWEGVPGFFRLKFLGENAWRSFPLGDLLRLEPTARVRPKGNSKSDLGAFERSPLDNLLDLTSCGNNSVIENAVLVLMARSDFAKIADAITLTTTDASQNVGLSHFLPWGFIGHDGTLQPNDSYQVVGEPLVVATGVPEDLALAASSVGAGTKIVLVDGARRIARDLQAFDDIASCQRVVILTSADESEDINLLKERGCPVWYMSAKEILIGENSAGRRTRNSLVGTSIRAADVRHRSSVNMVSCRDEVLEAAASSLERVAELIEDCEEAFEVEETLARLFGVLFECSECCFGVADDTVTELRTAREQLVQHARWLESSVAKELKCSVDALELAVTTSVGGQKADAFLNILSDYDRQWAVAARSPRTAERIREALADLGADLPVLPVSAISSDHEYAGIIVPAWPNRRRFTRLRNLSVAPEIRVLIYPFERKWVIRHQARERAQVRANRLESEMRSSILGVEPRFLLGLERGENKVEDAPRDNETRDLPVFRLEERVARRRVVQHARANSGQDSRKAQLVQFLGGCYTLLTEWATLPVLNDLIDNSKKGEQAKLVHSMVSRLSIGDFVLFRDSGDKEFIRLIAEDLLGMDEYQSIRDIAERWKLPLRRLGSSPAEVRRRLKKFGVNRTLPTIAGWLSNPDRIGPGNYGDIDAIAKAADVTELLSVKHEITDAISRIRRAHLAAGMQLTQLILGELHGRLTNLDEQPTLLDLDYGKAWIVQVESIESERQDYPSNQVNRLLWMADSAF